MSHNVRLEEYKHAVKFVLDMPHCQYPDDLSTVQRERQHGYDDCLNEIKCRLREYLKLSMDGHRL
jgi:hypothetical protein